MCSQDNSQWVFDGNLISKIFNWILDLSEVYQLQMGIIHNARTVKLVMPSRNCSLFHQPWPNVSVKQGLTDHVWPNMRFWAGENTGEKKLVKVWSIWLAKIGVFFFWRGKSYHLHRPLVEFSNCGNWINCRTQVHSRKSERVTSSKRSRCVYSGLLYSFDKL
jgi:hypothetical protein